jgi:hypothetical protein
MAFNFSPTSYNARPLDFSALANVPDQFWKGQAVGREAGLRDVLGEGLPTDPQGNIDWAKAASIVGQFDPELGMRTAAYAQKQTMNPYQAGMLGIAEKREDRLAQAPEVTPAQKRALEIQEERLSLAREAASRLPQNAIGGVAMIDAADKELTPEKRAMLTRKWSPQEMAGATTNIGEMAQAQSIVRTKVEAALRLMTGAAAPEQEVQRYIDMFMPGALDSEQRKVQKLKLLDAFGENAKKNALQGRPVPGSTPTGAPPTGGSGGGDEAQLIGKIRKALEMGHTKESIAAALKEDGVDDARIQEFLSGGP